MPKLIMTFELPEEDEELERYQKSNDYLLVLIDFSAEINRRLKHETLSEDVYYTLEQTRQKLNDLLDYYKVVL